MTTVATDRSVRASTPARAKRTPEAHLLDSLGSLIGKEECDRYFRRHARLHVANDRVQVHVRSAFVRDLVARRFDGPLREAAASALGGGERGDIAPQEITIEIAIAPHPGERSTPAAPAGTPQEQGAAHNGHARRRAKPIPPRQPGWASTLRSHHRLEDFLVGPSNRMAYEAAVRLTSKEQDGGFLRLVVHGACGLGKTHLLQGVMRRFRENFPGLTAHYATAEAFTNEYIQAVKTDRVGALRRRLRAVDMLCIDDVHFLSSKRATQEELLHTFDALDLAGARVCLASDEHPRSIQRLNRALVSRCMAGMTCRLDEPDRDLARRLACAIAARRGLHMQPCAADYIADACPGSVREMEGLITRVAAFSRISGRDSGAIDAATVRGACAGETQSATSRPVSVRAIATEVCRRMGVSEAELASRSRHARIVLARDLVAWLSRRLTTRSYPEIAADLSRAGHSSVINACTRMRARLAAGERVPMGHDAQEGDIALHVLIDRLAHDILKK